VKNTALQLRYQEKGSVPPDSSFLIYSFILISTMETSMTKGCTCVCGLGLYICVTKGYTCVCD